MTAVLGWRRPLWFGGLAALLVLLIGGLVERRTIGWTDAGARARAIGEIQGRVATADLTVTQVARALAGRIEVRAGMTGDRPAVRSLFDLVQTAADDDLGLAITIYDSRAAPRAWYGRPAELRPQRVHAGPLGFIAMGPAGLRLVHVEPIVDSASEPGGAARRLGSVVVERVLSPTTEVGAAGPDFGLQTTAGWVQLVPLDARPTRDPAAPDRPRTTFRSRTPAGERGRTVPGAQWITIRGAVRQPLMAARIGQDEIRQTRGRWQRRVLALFFLVLAVTVFASGWQRLIQSDSTTPMQVIAIGGLTVAIGGYAAWVAFSPGLIDVTTVAPLAYRSVQWPGLLRTPADLLLASLLACTVVGAIVLGDRRWRWAGRYPVFPRTDRMLLPIAAVLAVAVLLGAQHWILRDTVAGSSEDLLVTALQPFDLARTAVQLALVLLTASTVWAVAWVVAAARIRWRPQRRARRWLLPLFVAVPPVIVSLAAWVPLVPAALTSGVGVLLAFRGRRLRRWFHRTDPVAQVLATLCAVLIPAISLYMALVTLTDEAKRRLLAARYAVQAAEHPQDLQRQLDLTLEQIDALPGLETLTIPRERTSRTYSIDLDGLPGLETLTIPRETAQRGLPDTDRAFAIWRRTALAASRLTSAVEIYGAEGELTSRFALNIPEYGVAASRSPGTGCEWEVFGEVAPFGSEERRMLHAERMLCEIEGREGSTIVVHVAQVDYESLPFIASRSPYAELFAATPARALAPPGHEIELVIYGWGRQPVFLSGQSAWAIDDALFQQIYVTNRTPFWTQLSKDSRVYNVFLVNTRAGIYALGYPVHRVFDHLLHFSDLALLVIATFALGFVALLLAAVVFPTVRRRLPYQEIRARFALKLQLWFIGVATAPIVVVAVFIQGYFADQLRADVEAGAASTAAVAQRVIESVALQPSDAQVVTPFTDDVLVWMSEVVGQDINIFDGPRLVATSERDLYASGLLATRTPDQVYRAVVLDQLPNFVGDDAVGSLQYQLAATPVRMGGADVILTVPLASRQQEIEGQIDELNRRVRGSALFFAAVVGVIGWIIARSVANPVKRLTRATTRIARGEFTIPVSTRQTDLLQKRVAARSADELALLESDFNRMAVELDVRRRQLERTHRLEAWTEMARQVAHEIKNPLTPVQLSAEHLLRVHSDRGEPLTPVLQGCVESILKQVRILRQIASEFSSYASSPVADRVPIDLGELVRDVITPYQPGLESRISVMVEAPESLPKLTLDRMLMQRALTNIIENALHAMPGEGALSVRIERRHQDVRLVVEDTGVGLEPEVLTRIFEPYFSTRVTGTGLGMAIAKRNVELNGGTIAVTSQRGEGTAVTMTLGVT